MDEGNIFDLSDQLKPKRKHFSKRSKKAWRKHTKVDDVLQFIDDQREEDLIKHAIENQSTENIFSVDKKSTKQKKVGLPVQQKKTRTNVFFKYLQPDPISYPALRQRKPIKINEEKKIDHNADEIKIKKIIKSSKEKKIDLDGLCAPAVETDVTDKRIKAFCPVYDLWGAKAPSSQNETLLHSDLLLYTKEQTKARQTEKKQDTSRTYRKVLRNEVKGLEKVDEKMAQNRLKKLKSLPSWLPAIEIPHSGTSYNPTKKAVKQIVRKVEKKKAIEEKQEQHLYRNMTRFIPTKEEAVKIQEENERALRAGLEMSSKREEGSESENEKEADELDDEEKAKIEHQRSLQSRDRRRLQSKRRRQAEENKKVEKSKKKKLERKRVHEVTRIKQHLKQLKISQAKAKIRKQNLVKKELKKMYKTRRLGKMRYDSSSKTPCVTKKSKGNLLSLNSEGNLLHDRYDSLLRRNMLEVRVKRQRKARKIRYVPKQGCREEDIIDAKLT